MTSSLEVNEMYFPVKSRKRREEEHKQSMRVFNNTANAFWRDLIAKLLTLM